MSYQRFASVLAALSVLLCASLPAAAAGWPDRPLHLIVPFGAGSTPDIVARLVSDKLQQRIGEPVVVINKPGAGGNLGTQLVAEAAPDGYTLGLTISGPLAANTLLFKNLPYDPQRDLDYLTIAATQPSILVVSAKSGITDMPSLLAKLRSNPGKYNFSSMGVGSISHLAMEALAASSGTEIVHVPYASSAQAVTALLSGQTQMAILPAAMVMAQIHAGTLKALAVATAKRFAVMPEVPTLSEAGLKNVQGDAWMGFVMPAKTPAAITQRLTKEIVAIVNSPDIKKKLQAQYMEPVGDTPAEFRAIVRGDLERWAPIIKKNHITLD
ncbi:tripartite tricarboxylate transporter family receptor [mine drainage metagenome]|uniref:Tripartite tricarboxylate transporter family receptor n=1 Tax=mine drainage metagenome TaxID=410659 RepID=A0A1J5RD03_9ZZZZ